MLFNLKPWLGRSVVLTVVALLTGCGPALGNDKEEVQRGGTSLVALDKSNTLLGWTQSASGHTQFWSIDSRNPELTVLGNSTTLATKRPNVLVGSSPARIVWVQAQTGENPEIEDVAFYTVHRGEPTVPLDFLGVLFGDEGPVVGGSAIGVLESRDYLVTDEAAEDYSMGLWDLSSMNRVGGIDGNIENVIYSISPAFGPGQGFFVAFGSRSSSSGDWTYKLFLYQIDPFVLLADFDTYENARVLGVFDGFSRDTLMARVDDGHQGFAKISLVTDGGQHTLEMDSVQWLPGHDNYGLQFRGGVFGWVPKPDAGEPVKVILAETPDGPRESQATIPLDPNLAHDDPWNYLISEDGSVVVTFDGSETINVWNISLPNITHAWRGKVENSESDNGALTLTLEKSEVSSTTGAE